MRNFSYSRIGKVLTLIDVALQVAAIRSLQHVHLPVFADYSVGNAVRELVAKEAAVW